MGETASYYKLKIKPHSKVSLVRFLPKTPNVIIFYRYFEGRDIVLRATRPLSPGEVVSENYGPHFMTRSLRDRQRSLACRYWFKCECVTCKEDWPTMKQMKSGPPYLRSVKQIAADILWEQIPLNNCEFQHLLTLGERLSVKKF